MKTKTLLLSDSYLRAVQTAVNELIEQGCEIVQVVSSTDTYTSEYDLICTERSFLIIYKEGEDEN